MSLLPKQCVSALNGWFNTIHPIQNIRYIPYDSRTPMTSCESKASPLRSACTSFMALSCSRYLILWKMHSFQLSSINWNNRQQTIRTSYTLCVVSSIQYPFCNYPFSAFTLLVGWGHQPVKISASVFPMEGLGGIWGTGITRSNLWKNRPIKQKNKSLVNPHMLQKQVTGNSSVLQYVPNNGRSPLLLKQTWNNTNRTVIIECS